MSRRPIREVDIENPSRILDNLINDYIEGNLDDNSVFYRAIVVSVDHEGGKLQGPNDEAEQFAIAANPRNSIKARVITKAMNWHLSDGELPIFWPLFSHDIMPVKEGEHVYVIFEDAADIQTGLWIGRIPEPFTTHSPNFTPGKRKYKEFEKNDFGEVPEQQALQDAEGQDVKEPKLSAEFVQEIDAEKDKPDADDAKVKLFRARVGDRVIEGSNNALVVIGRDRPADIESGEKEEAGTVDIVTGRQQKDNMDMEADKSRIYVSSKSDIDKNLKIVDIEPAVSADSDVGFESVVKEDLKEPAPCIGLKSDEIRIFARKRTKVVVGNDNGSRCTIVVDDDGKITIEAADALQLLIGGETKINLQSDVVSKVDGKVQNTITGDNENNIEGNETVEVKGDSSVTVKGSDVKDVGGTLDLKSGDTVTINSGGDVSVSGGNITLSADSVTLDAKNTALGGAGEPLIFGDQFFTELATFVGHIADGKPVADLFGIPLVPHQAFVAAATLFKVKLELPAIANPMKSADHKVKA